MTSFTMWDKTPGEYTDLPVLTYYPADDKKTDATVVIFPGGGYHCRCAYEGQGYAEYLNTLGMDAFVVEYRVHPHAFPLPLLDARRAIRYIRYHSKRFGIDPNKIAVMGSSAGGHLAALVSNYREPLGEEWEGLDEIDEMCPTPNASILCYPVIHISNLAVGHIGSACGLMGSNMQIAPSLDPIYLASEKTPPTFLWHTSDDECVDVKNSLLYGVALKEKGVRFEMHIFPHGRHGLALSNEIPHVQQWADLLVNWLKQIDFLI